MMSCRNKKTLLRDNVKKLLQQILRIESVKRMVQDVYLGRLLRFPQRVQIEIINVCNADCIMCPLRNMTRKKGTMDFELYRDIIDQCADNDRPPKVILPFLNGEPLIHPYLSDYIRYAKNKLPRSQISLSTNGSLLDEKRSLELLDSGLDILNISFDGPDKETFEKVRRNLRFEVVNENILRFIRLREKRGQRKPLVNLSIIDMEETRAGISLFLRKWGQIADTVTVEPLSNWGEEVGVEEERRNVSRQVPCPRLWYDVVIFLDGKVPLCCLDYDGKVIIGDVKKELISQIWTGETLNYYRYLHIQGSHNKISLCSMCNYPEYAKIPIWWWNPV